MVARQNRFLTQNLYQLKRQFGVPLRLVRRTAIGSVDVRTGQPSVSYDSYEIQYAVLLPTKETTNKEWSREVQEFSRGGYFEIGTRSFIIDTRDLPEDFKIKEDDYLVYNDRRYDIFEIQDYEELRAFFVRGLEAKGAPIYDAPQVEGEGVLVFDGDAQFVLN